jgi:DNA-binding NarL/FixJ family response regulator
MGAKVVRTQRLLKPKERTDESKPHSVETLVRQLVAHARHAAHAPAHTAPDASPQEDSGEVLVDCEVDGVRCVLARTHSAPADQVHLSPRELEVARMIAKGYPNKIIASVLEISVWTVSTHLRRIFAKLGVSSRAAMVTSIFKHRRL